MEEPAAGARAEPGRWLGSVRAVARALLALPRTVALLFPLVWGGLIWLGSEFAGQIDGPEIPGMHFLGNGVHAFEFGVLALLCLPLLPRRSLSHGPWVQLEAPQIAWLLLLVGGYGVFDELHQAQVPGRIASPFDALTDLVGAICVVAVARLAGRQAATDGELRGRLLGGLVACSLAAGLATWNDLQS